jgi:hypothetical protein
LDAFGEIFKECAVAFGEDMPREVLAGKVLSPISEADPLFRFQETAYGKNEGVDRFALNKETVLAVNDSVDKSFQSSSNDREASRRRFDNRDAEAFHVARNANVWLNKYVSTREEESFLFGGDAAEEVDATGNMSRCDSSAEGSLFRSAAGDSVVDMLGEMGENGANKPGYPLASDETSDGAQDDEMVDGATEEFSECFAITLRRVFREGCSIRDNEHSTPVSAVSDR